MLLWLNGKLLPADEARIDPADRGFLLGDGLFETMCFAEGRVRHLSRHLARLRQGAGVLRIPLEYDNPVLEGAIAQLVRAHQLAQAAVRLTLTAGVGPRGLARPAALSPTLMIGAAPLPAPLAPAALIVAESTRRNEASPLSRLKTLGYLDQLLARREAEARGADDAILLNTCGELAGATAATLLLHDGREWLTPSVYSGALPGIARGLLIEAGLVREAVLLPEDLEAAEQLLLINALGQREVSRVEERVLEPRPDLIAPLRDPAIAPDGFEGRGG